MKTRIGRGVGRGTPVDLLEATACGARIAARSLRACGLDEEAVRRRILDRFRAEFRDDGPGELTVETLMAVVQRSVEEVFGHPGPVPGCA